MIETDVVRLILLAIMVVASIVIFRIGKNRAGRMLKLIGTLHILSGVYVARMSLLRIFREGFFGEADSALGHYPSEISKELIFWFLVWGPFAFIIGMLVSWFEGRGKYPPASIGWALAVASLASVMVDPKTGFWWVLVPAFLIIRGPHVKARTT